MVLLEGRRQRRPAGELIRWHGVDGEVTGHGGTPAGRGVKLWERSAAEIDQRGGRPKRSTSERSDAIDRERQRPFAAARYADRSASANSATTSSTGRTWSMPATLRPACQKSRFPLSSNEDRLIFQPDQRA